MAEWLHFHFSLSCIGEGNGDPLQCSCLENPRDGVAQGRTRLTRLSSSNWSYSAQTAITTGYHGSSVEGYLFSLGNFGRQEWRIQMNARGVFYIMRWWIRQRGWVETSCFPGGEGSTFITSDNFLLHIPKCLQSLMAAETAYQRPPNPSKPLWIS